jgi:hypothetical protein
MADTDIVIDEREVSQKVGATAHATPDELVEIANGIWRQVGKSGVEAGDSAGNDKLLEKLQAEHRDFSLSFPIILRWMVQMRLYKPRTFKLYLIKHATADFSSREKFLEMQAEYLVLLFKSNNRNVTADDVRRYREECVKKLLEEDKKFMEVQEEVAAQRKAEAAAADQDVRRRLVEFLAKGRV